MTTDAALRFLDTRIAHGMACRECSELGWIGACGWNDPDPLFVDDEPWVLPDDIAPASHTRLAVFLVAAALVAVLLLRRLR